MKTQFFNSIVTEKDSFKAGQKLAKQVDKEAVKNFKSRLGVLFCSDDYNYEKIQEGIKSVLGDINLIGCTSAGQFINNQLEERGVACAFIFSDDYQFYLGKGDNLKEDPISAVQQAVASFPKTTKDFPYASAILFLDGLAGKGEEAVLAASSLLGGKVRIAGGAASDNLAFQKTEVFCNEEAFSDGVSMCYIASRKPIILSFKHGHHPISPPLTVTKAEGNILYELEGKPAIEVWKEYLRERLKKIDIDIDKMNSHDLSLLLVKYEAGLKTGDNEYKIRFPVSANPDGSLNFVSSMLEGSVIKIMDSDIVDQMKSAEEAVKLVLKSAGTEKIAGGIFFDCVCRGMILKEKYKDSVALKSQYFKNIPFIGGETYGEIAMHEGDFSGFHNTTTVIMLFPQ